MCIYIVSPCGDHVELVDVGEMEKEIEYRQNNIGNQQFKLFENRYQIFHVIACCF